MKIFKNRFIYIEIEKSKIPWLKIFTKTKYKEFSQCDLKTKKNLLKAIDTIEKEMIKYYQPDKINIASFGNYMPIVHFHIMARFKNDSFFPEPMWGKKQRKAKLKLKNFNKFIKIIKHKLSKTL